MSLFINHGKSSKVYQTDTEVVAPNQDEFKLDPVTELLKSQEQANDSLQRSLRSLEETHTKQARIQARRMTSVQVKLNRLNDRDVAQKEMENDVENLFEKYSEQHEALTSKIEHQLSAQISKQEDFQQEIIKRLDKQEAITEKLLRKMDDFRSILYERTNFLTEKIEQAYDSTSAYLFHMMPGRKQIAVTKEKQEKPD